MRHLILFSLIFFGTLTAQAQVKLESGLLLHGGTGSMKATLNPPPADRVYSHSDFKNKASFSVGYRFRLLPVNSRFFYDLDLNIGGRLWNYDYSAPLNENSHEGYYWGITHNSSTKGLFASLGATVGYKLYKGLSIGAGIEPTYNFYQSHGITGDSNDGTGNSWYYIGGNDKKRPFDVPLVGRVAYNFKFMEVGLSYKHGLFNTVKNDQIKSGKFSDWQLSLFIPF